MYLTGRAGLTGFTCFVFVLFLHPDHLADPVKKSLDFNKLGCLLACNPGGRSLPKGLVDNNYEYGKPTFKHSRS